MLDFLEKAELPKTIVINKKKYYFDPIREKPILIQPEETVRQKVISYIIHELKVPVDMIRVEERLSHYGIKTYDRADIIIDKYNEENDMLNPLVVIECKAPEVMLDEYAAKQLMRYTDYLAAPFCMMTNGYDQTCYYYDDKRQRYIEIKSLPKYIEMVAEQYIEAPRIKPLDRLTLEEIKAGKAHYREISDDTPRHLRELSMNLWECLLFTEGLTLPKGKFGIFEMVEDYGLRMLRCGDANGGVFQGVYHSFMVKYKRKTKFVSIGFTRYCTDARPEPVRTALCVAIENEENKPHHSLQLVIDDNVESIMDDFTIYHHGRIAVGQIGSGKISELREFVEKSYPQIIDGKRFKLGKLKNDHLFTLADEDIIQLIENLISYSLIRDDYREYVKKNRKR